MSVVNVLKVPAVYLCYRVHEYRPMFFLKYQFLLKRWAIGGKLLLLFLFWNRLRNALLIESSKKTIQVTKI